MWLLAVVFHYGQTNRKWPGGECCSGVACRNNRLDASLGLELLCEEIQLFCINESLDAFPLSSDRASLDCKSRANQANGEVFSYTGPSQIERC